MLEEKFPKFHHYIPQSFPLPLVVVTCGILFVLIFFFSYRFFRHMPPQPSELEPIQLGLTAPKAQERQAERIEEFQTGEKEGVKPPEEIYVHVDGEVNNPGLYKLPAGARVDEAIKLAGGLREGANTRSLNFAHRLEDGMKLYIPSEKEAEQTSLQESAQALSPSSQQNLGKININTANLAELQHIKGIGERTAAAIIEERNKRGNFKSEQDICRVPGIGTKKYEQIKDSICVR